MIKVIKLTGARVEFPGLIDKTYTLIKSCSTTMEERDEIPFSVVQHCCMDG